METMNQHQMQHQMQNQMNAMNVRVIKRYQNRKLYDTLQSRYITLEELAKIIRLGIDIKVLDNKSQDDITYQTMLQLIFEMEKKAEGLENVPQTMRVIRFADGLISSYLNWLETSLNIASVEKELRPRVARPTWHETQEPGHSTSSQSTSIGHSTSHDNHLNNQLNSQNF